MGGGTVDMALVDIDFGCCLPNFAWADGNQAELARHMVEHPI